MEHRTEMNWPNKCAASKGWIPPRLHVGPVPSLPSSFCSPPPPSFWRHKRQSRSSDPTRWLQASVTCHYHGPWGEVSEGWFTNQGNLKVGDSEVILVPVPTNAPAWRLFLTVLRDEPFRMLAASLAAEARRLVLGRQPITRSSGCYPVTSDPINQ